MTFKQILLASCALVISATAATAQIPSYVPTDGLVGWWPFNGNANDESGNGNDGVVNGAILANDRNGNVFSCYSFDGNDFIRVLNSSSLVLNQSFTVEGWVNISELITFNSFISNSSNDQSSVSGYVWGYSNFSNPPRIHFQAYPNFNGVSIASQGGNLQLGNWHNLICTYDHTNSGLRYYLDGSLTDTFIVDFDIYDVNLDVFFGNHFQNNNPLTSVPTPGGLTGLLDDIAIYNRALTPQEIQNLYNSSTTTVDTGDGAALLPQGIPYQAAARDAQGQSLVNAAVNVRFTLHEGAADGAASYAETHALTTNGVGLFNTVFGNGTPEQSAFDSINWAATTKFLQVEIDLGEGYVDMGTTQLLSVPYALRSDEAARVKNAGLPIFNDNAAALAGGLVAGEMYRTSAGVLMVAY
jgi:hypothetical protein